jgi:hypothetical protein
LELNQDDRVRILTNRLQGYPTHFIAEAIAYKFEGVVPGAHSRNGVSRVCDTTIGLYQTQNSKTGALCAQDEYEFFKRFLAEILRPVSEAMPRALLWVWTKPGDDVPEEYRRLMARGGQATAASVAAPVAAPLAPPTSDKGDPTLQEYQHSLAADAARERGDAATYTPGGLGVHGKVHG